MNRILATLVFIALAVPLFAGGDINWVSYEDGMKESAASGKLVVIDFHADWCKYCVKMDKETFTNKAVIKEMTDNFVCISVDTDKEKELQAEYGAKSLPTFWFLESDGKRINYLPGFADASVFLAVLQYLSSDSYKTVGFEDYMKKAIQSE
jgi:thioredoxin-related protein